MNANNKINFLRVSLSNLYKQYAFINLCTACHPVDVGYDFEKSRIYCIKNDKEVTLYWKLDHQVRHVIEQQYQQTQIILTWVCDLGGKEMVLYLYGSLGL